MADENRMARWRKAIAVTVVLYAAAGAVVWGYLQLFGSPAAEQPWAILLSFFVVTTWALSFIKLRHGRRLVQRVLFVAQFPTAYACMHLLGIMRARDLEGPAKGLQWLLIFLFIGAAIFA